MQYPAHHHKRETNVFAVASQITMKETVITGSSCATTARGKAISPVCVKIKSDHKHTKEKHETKMKPKKHFDKAKGKIHKVEANASDSERESVSDSDSELRLHMVSAVINDTEPVMAVKKDDAASSLMMIRAKIEGLVINMELDTGAAVSLISMDMYKGKLAHLRLQKTEVVLKTYTGEHTLLPEGMLKVWVKLNKQKVKLPLYVVKGESAPLFGREWLGNIKLD